MINNFMTDNKPRKLLTNQIALSKNTVLALQIFFAWHGIFLSSCVGNIEKLRVFFTENPFES